MTLLLFDLDGTLLTRERSIHPANLEVLTELMERGVWVSLATGRPPRSVKRYAEMLRPNAPLIHFNGAVVRDWQSGEVIEKQNLQREDALAALSIGSELGIHANVYVGDEIFIEKWSAVSEASEIKDGVPQTVVGNLNKYLTDEKGDPIKIMFIGEPSVLPGLERALRGALDSPCTLVNSEPNYLEMLPAGVTKATGARALAAHLGITLDDAIAFGDNKNDIELLEACGHGVAMANAVPALVERANETIGDHDTAAIADFLRLSFPR